MINQFIPQIQLDVLRDTDNEEKQFFTTIINDLTQRIETMPVTYEQDSISNPIVYLHYFTGAYDAYITEKDISGEQLQAYGYINLGFGFEQGYINIKELIKNGFELDFHFEAKPIKEII